MPTSSISVTTEATEAGSRTVVGGASEQDLLRPVGAVSHPGSPGNDSITGSDGDDNIAGGTGDDTLSGGAGADTFIYTVGEGSDTVTDFGNGADRVVIFGASSVSVTDDGAAAVVSVDGGGQITLWHDAAPSVPPPAGPGDPEPPPPPIDWDALAAEVTTNFEETGQWFL
jgi:Ca2+-binding RTX toxin-like protein